MSCRHEFVDVYDTEETLPESVIASAALYKVYEHEVEVLNAGKVKTKKHVMSYCKLCGLSMGRGIVVNTEPVGNKQTKILEGLSTE